MTMAEKYNIFQKFAGERYCEILISGEEIQKRVTEIAAQIDEYYANSPNNLILLGILKRLCRVLKRSYEKE